MLQVIDLLKLLRTRWHIYICAIDALLPDLCRILLSGTVNVRGKVGTVLHNPV